MSYCSTLLSVAKFYHFLSCVDLVRFSAPLMAVPFSFELSIAVGPFRFLCINFDLSMWLPLSFDLSMWLPLSFDLGEGAQAYRAKMHYVYISLLDVDGVGRDCEDYNQC